MMRRAVPPLFLTGTGIALLCTLYVHNSSLHGKARALAAAYILRLKVQRWEDGPAYLTHHPYSMTCKSLTHVLGHPRTWPLSTPKDAKKIPLHMAFEALFSASSLKPAVVFSALPTTGFAGVRATASARSVVRSLRASR
jgi:hypothetical protein